MELEEIFHTRKLEFLVIQNYNQAWAGWYETS